MSAGLSRKEHAVPDAKGPSENGPWSHDAPSVARKVHTVVTAIAVYFLVLLVGIFVGLWSMAVFVAISWVVCLGVVRF